MTSFHIYSDLENNQISIRKVSEVLPFPNKNSVYKKTITYPDVYEEAKIYMECVLGTVGIDQGEWTTYRLKNDEDMMRIEIMENDKLWVGFIDSIKDVYAYYIKFIDPTRVDEFVKNSPSLSIQRCTSCELVEYATGLQFDRLKSSRLVEFLIRYMQINSSAYSFDYWYISGVANAIRLIYMLKTKLGMKSINTDWEYLSYILKSGSNRINPSILLEGRIEKIFRFVESTKNFHVELVDLIDGMYGQKKTPEPPAPTRNVVKKFIPTRSENEKMPSPRHINYNPFNSSPPSCPVSSKPFNPPFVSNESSCSCTCSCACPRSMHGNKQFIPCGRNNTCPCSCAGNTCTKNKPFVSVYRPSPIEYEKGMIPFTAFAPMM